MDHPATLFHCLVEYWRNMGTHAQTKRDLLAQFARIGKAVSSPARLERAGALVIDKTAEHPISASDSWANFNPFAGSAAAAAPAPDTPEL